MLPALRRLPQVRGLIDGQLYFVLHAPRQSGKTTALTQLAQELTREGRYAALLVSMEAGATFSDREGDAESAILDTWKLMALNGLPPELRPPDPPDASAGSRLSSALAAWSRGCPRPVVLFMDEIDALRDNALLSVLRQLRLGYPSRPGHYPWSLALIGLRDVRDDKVASGGSSRLGTSSPFNVLTESLTLRSFTREEVAELYGQHSTDTGQVFEPGAIDRAFHWSQGQPWLVNALARQLVEQLVPDRTRSIRARDVDAAKETLILRQDTHLDSLAERLREDRVRAIVEPILAGGVLPPVPDDDLRYVLDLGLLRRDPAGSVEVANPIYKEVVPRVLGGTTQASLPSISPTWLRPDGSLDATRLLESFLSFWRQHGEPLLRSAPYHEIAPQLVLMAFLHRVANGEGTIEREYAIGSGRMDLCLRYRDAVLAFELKVWRDGESDPVQQGLGQLDAYLEGLGLSEGWLVIFDRRERRAAPAKRTTARARRTPRGRSVTVVRA
jgi:hypothetical protein